MRPGTSGAASRKPRARELGIPFGGKPGPWNAITDVPGVEVGYRTLIEGTDVRTGVTAIHPRGSAGAGDPISAGTHNQNGNGEMTGVSWISEAGQTAGPICITNTHAVGVAHAGIIAWTVKHHPDLAETWLMPVAAETYDGYLNDINGHHVTEEIVVEAIEAADSGPLQEGSVGGGTGMNCYRYKAGSGTASRIVEYGGTDYTVGVFLQTNFGLRRELTVGGVPVGLELLDDDPLGDFEAIKAEASSCIAVVLTDAPLLADQCRAMARRVTRGLARTGQSGSHYSGDLFFAGSVGNPGAITPSPRAGEAVGRYDELRFIPWGLIDPFYEAVVQATEEAVINSMVANDELVGFRGHRTPGIPVARVLDILRRRGLQPA